MNTVSDYDSYVLGMEAMAGKLYPLMNSAEHTWLYEAMGGGSSESGMTVNYRTSMTLAYVWSCQQIISGDVASLPFDTKRVEQDGDLTLDTSLPAYWAMNGDANRNMTAYSLRETLTHHALMCGNGMAYIFRRGQDLELIPAVRGALKPEINDAGLLVYHDSENNETWSQWDILHIKGLGDDGYSGLSWLQMAKNSVGLGLAENRHGARHFSKGAKPSIVLKYPGQLTKEKANELLERFEARHENDARPALASGGLEIEAMDVKNSDAQWLESRKFTRQEVAAWFNLPPHKIGDDARTGYNSIIAENQAYVTQTLRRWLKRWESEVSRKLIRGRDRRAFRVVCSHDSRPLIETDQSELTDQVVKQITAMVITPNEGRRRLGYPRIEGGDSLINPNTTSGAANPEPNTGTESNAGDSGQMRDALVSSLSDRLQTLCNAIGQQCKRKNKGEQPLDAEWASQWPEKARDYASPTLAVAQVADGVNPADVSIVCDAVAEWVQSMWNGGAAVPSPEDLAAQMIGV